MAGLLRARLAGRRLAALTANPVRRESTKPVTQDAAYLFGEVPGHHKPEGWEGIMLVTTVASFAVFGFLSCMPETRLKVWAREEAAERISREDAGLPVEYGHHYAAEAAKAKVRYVQVLGQMPDMADEEEEETDE